MMAVYVLGLDGATWDLLDPLMQEGHLPHLAGLVGQGLRAPLLSTWPPVTSLAWPTFCTGVNPGRHGVFSFVRLDEQGRERVIDARSVRAPALWDLVSAAGMRVGVVGVPVTYPVHAVNGFFISGFLTPAGATAACHPPELLAGVAAAEGVWRFHIPPLEGEINLERTRAFTEHLAADMALRQRVLLRLLDRYQPDLFVHVWMHTDTIQHTYWGYLQPGHPFYDRPEATGIRDLLLPIFKQLDLAIAELADRVLPDGTLLIVSDHGFGPMHRRLAVNAALAQHGYLALHSARLLWARIQRRARRRLAGWLREEDALRHVGRNRQQNAYINWRRTRAFAGATHELCVHLNRTDRYPHGIVMPEHAANLQEELREMLLALRDGENRPLFAAVYRPEELYSGPYLPSAPDLVLQPVDPRDVVTDGLVRGRRLWRWETHHAGGWHRREGIFLAVGQGEVGIAGRSVDLSLVDVAPTVLTLLGLEPPEMDGASLFQPSHRLRPIPPVDAATAPALQMAEADELELRERLRGLGYLD